MAGPFGDETDDVSVPDAEGVAEGDRYDAGSYPDGIPYLPD